MNLLIWLAIFVFAAAGAVPPVAGAAAGAGPAAVRSYEATISIPTYEHVGREMEPPLFGNSTVTGMYPFTTYLPAFRPGPNPQTYRALILENEYLKLTYIPEFGDRIFSVYDKLRRREMLYRNDVIKPAPYNPRNSWPQSGMELTGPHDLHTLTLHGEPYWANKVLPAADGSVSLVLGETDPVYGMEVTLSATLHPGLAALDIKVFCYNPNDGRKPQMFWINTAINATPKTRFIYPMSRTVGHTTAEIADWPLYHGTDYSWDRNNKHMLGVFGIDIYDNFQGAYQFDRDYGIFRYGDRRVVQGMKLWTFGYGPEAKNYEDGYTDHAGPYVELQSGRHVWDGHYEWVAPHQVEGWSEWWIPVSQTGGLTTLSRDLALHLAVDSASANGAQVHLALAPTRVLLGAKLSVKAKCGELFNKTIDFDPATTYQTDIFAPHAGPDGLTQLVVSVTDAAGHSLLNYRRPDEDPGRKEYTPFTRPLEQPRKSPEEMSVEELTLAAEYQLKELDETGAKELIRRALARDPGYSKAHLLLGIAAFNDGLYGEAIEHLNRAIERDAYQDAAYFYLAMSELALDQDAAAERNLYYIWPESAYFGEREYQLGRLAFLRGKTDEATGHFRRAVEANGNDLWARLALAVTLRQSGEMAAAAIELASVEAVEPTNRPAAAERWLQQKGAASQGELLRLLGAQTQEALALSTFYQELGQWSSAAQILELTANHNQDPWGTTAVVYYTLAYCRRRAGDAQGADAALRQAGTLRGNVDRFPYRRETAAALAEAVSLNPNDLTARFDYACVLYFRGHPREAIEQWRAAIAIDAKDFSSHRALGLAYAEQGMPIERSIAELELAISLQPGHVRTLDDLSAIYARAGRFEDQLSLLKDALRRLPSDDDLAEGVLAANLNLGRYEDAERIIASHRFATRHRSYTLRDDYRLIRCGMGVRAFRRRDYSTALQLFESALAPPDSLGIDTFENQSSPRIHYYLGRTLEELGRKQQANLEYLSSIAGLEQLSGDRDSWSSDNFFMVLSLNRLGRKEEAATLARHFVDFANTERDSTNAVHRAAALYLLSLASGYEGRAKTGRALVAQALDARPDLLAARLAVRGDELNEAAQTQAAPNQAAKE